MRKHHDWSQITREDIIEAIKIFNEENPTYPPPRNTYLVYEGKQYPAKHIRGMSYKVCYGSDITKDDYTGGIQTAKFLRTLGFDVLYIGESKRKASAEPPR